MKRFLILVLLPYFSLISDFPLSAQDTEYAAIKTEVRKLFEEHNYESALPLFRQLLDRYSKEPEYQFGTAVCMTRLNLDPEPAISLLEQVNISGFNPQSYYYLGLLLHRTYRFGDAIGAYSNFIKAGKVNDIKIFDVERLIEMARNGMEYTRSGKSLRVLEVKILSSGQLEKASDINSGARLIKKPLEFCSKTDLKEGFRPLIFLPSVAEMDDKLYIAGYERGKKNLRQIYCVRNINHETWSEPELLDDIINTPYDEDYPCFDAKNSTLYFSSKGHSSMGGYDIFRSVYDQDNKSWSPPENLGFPINSPYDDFFYMNDENPNTFSFVSNRNTGPGQVSLFKIKRLPDSSITRFVNIAEIQKASRLEPDSGIRLTQAVNKINILLTDNSDAAPGIGDNNYNKIISDALNLQLRSDSMGRIVRDKRLAAKGTSDPELKKQLINDIIRIERESKKLQREADLKFAEAWSLKGNENNAIPEDTTRVPAIQAENPVENTAEANNIPDDFRILNEPVYNASNPIPKGMTSHKGLVYRIQLGVFTKPPLNDAFRGISPVYFEKVNHSLKYYAGVFFSLKSVSMALEQVKVKGFPDAFIVAYLDDRLISTETAREIEFKEMKL